MKRLGGEILPSRFPIAEIKWGYFLKHGRFSPNFPLDLPYNGVGKGVLAMTVVYIDSVFVLNTVMDYLLLLSAARLAGLPLRRKRYLLAALAGGAYAAAVFLPGCGFLAAMPVKLAAGVLLGLIAYGGEECLLRLLLLFFSVSCGMAGCVLGLGLLAGSGVPVVNGVFYTNVNAKVLLISSAATYIVLTVVFRAAAKHGTESRLLPIRTCIGGRTVELRGLWDSGNGLQEPGGSRSVLVVSPGGLDAVLPKEARSLLHPKALQAPEELLEPLRKAAPSLRPRLLPYHAVGTTGGLLLAIRTDWTEVAGTRYPGLTAALSPTALGTGYTALWGGTVKKEGRHCEHFSVSKRQAADLAQAVNLARAEGAEVSGAAWSAAGGWNTLHWRKRHPAAAAEPGAGGGAAGQSGRGGPAGAD